MNDYYAELNLDRSLPLEGLQRELARQESVWKQRRTRGNPTVANRKLVLVEEARKAFSSEAARAEYDRRLSEGDRSPEDAPDEQQYTYWLAQARQFDQLGQADLAVGAIEKALATPGAPTNDAQLYLIVARLYLKVDDLSSAMRYANEAILLNPENPWGYLIKSHVLDMTATAHRNRGFDDEASRVESQLRGILLQASSLAEAGGQRDAQGTALGCYAFSLYLREPTDKEQAEAIARRALDLGDQWGNAQTVLDDISKERKRQSALELQRRQEAAQQAKERAEREAQAKKTEEERKRKDEERRKQEESARTTKGFYKLLASIGWLLLFACAYGIIRPVVDPALGSFDQRMAVYDFERTKVLLAAALAWLHTFDAAANDGDGSTSTFWGMVLALPHAFLAATAKYTQLGFGAASANEAWKALGVTLATYIAVIWVCSRIGTALSKGTKPPAS